MSPARLVVLAERAEVVVVAKPSGLLVHNSRFAGARERTLTDAVREQLGDDLHPVHRLDRQTSGCLLFARGGDATSRWQDALAAEEARKRYVALVRGHLSAPICVDHALRDVERKNRDAPARAARTHLAPIASSTVDRCGLVEARPVTGRTHQVRRHLKHVSHPVIGDANYGKGALNRAYRERYGLARMALHCASLRVRVDDLLLDVRAPFPEDLDEPLRALFPGDVVDAAARG